MLSLPAIIAANRFGLGARADEAPRIVADPKGWLRAQLDGPGHSPPELAGFASGATQTALFLETRRKRGDPGIEKLFREQWRQSFVDETGARTRAAATTPEPFRERLVRFWSNHFTVSAQRPGVLGLAGAFEREAVRPHVTGRFEDLLLAATRHQAMLFYLDNAVSIGPNSRVGRRTGKGLNENHAREILELHTVGVDGGYNQDDVRALAAMLTGWSVSRNERQSAIGAFHFYAEAHEPAAQTLMGRRVADGGREQGEAALRFLAAHPATSRHVALKLARHFVADDPPRPLVERLAAVFRDTGGDLKALALALIEAPEVWAEPLPKVRTAEEFVIAALRATGAVPAETMRLVGSLRELGQAPMTAPSPAGWPDIGRAWASPESLLRRIEWAMAAARRLGPAARADALLAHALGEAATAATRRAVAEARGPEAVALVLASAEFQRR